MVYEILQLFNLFSVGSPVVMFVKGKLSVQGLKDVELQGYELWKVGLKLSTIQQECLC
jgi:hypothetical protein